MTRVVVVDDHPVFRHGLVSLLESEGFDVVAGAAGAAEALSVIAALAPDVALLDLGLPDGDGLDVVRQVAATSPSIRIVVVTMYDDEGLVREAVAAGAAGYVVKDASPAQLVAAVRAAVLGAVVLGSSVVPAVGLLRPPAKDDPYGLTPRELDVLDLVARGLSNRQIAERLSLSGKTVSNNVSVLLAKLGVANRAEAARIARDQYG
ncbi:response regulator [Isoptericola sp. NPDC056578]|uniref:response regulator n=1 Tax=unclassified Isoptericola TaxID=2623355 RepID=UPI0036CDF338